MTNQNSTGAGEVHSFVSSLWTSCPRRSTLAVEFYDRLIAPTDDRPAYALRAVTYACDEHLPAARAVLAPLGSNPEPHQLQATDMHPDCGRRFDVALYRATQDLGQTYRRAS